MERGALLRMSLGTLAIFAVLAVWIVLNLDSRTGAELLSDGVGQSQHPDRCWR